jgi:hypothetical protein
MTRRVYRIVVTGEMGPAMGQAFPELQVQPGHGRTVLSGDLVDQASLHAILGRLQGLGLDLIELSVEREAR